MAQAGTAVAAPASQTQGLVSGVVQSITLETHASGITTVSVDVMDGDQMLSTVRVSLETGIAMGLIILNGDGKPEINPMALGKPVEIDSTVVLPDKEESQHPVGSALATFFAGVEGVDYAAIMAAHQQGTGFGGIAQMLWLTMKMDGDAEVFQALLTARETGDYSAFVLEDGSVPQNWGQLKKAILEGDKNGSVGVTMGKKDKENQESSDQGNKEKDKDKKDKENNGENGNKDKEKDKDKNKDKEKDK